MKIPRLLAVLTLFAVAGCSASGSGPAGQPAQRPVVLTSSQVTTLSGLGTSDTSFGLNLLAQLCQAQPGGNVAISPVSLATGLGMAELGAKGATAAAIARALGQGPGSPATAALTASLAARKALLGSLNRPGVTFSESNRIWADPTLHTNASFLAAVLAADQAGMTQVPLLTQPERARQAINAAIGADTRGHIPELIPASAMMPPPGWVLTDALYLNAAWRYPFDPNQTVAGQFSTIQGQVSVEYMNGEGVAAGSADGWKMAALPYRGGRLTMLALLPPLAAVGGGGGLPGPACELPTPKLLATLTAQVSAGSAAISLPKVNLATSASLRQPLTALGMGLAFSQNADFTPLSPQACCVGFVQHAATLAVTERGTVATAATAVGMVPTAGYALQIQFDRPYLLLLRDGLTGEPLMLAWVANPARA